MYILFSGFRGTQQPPAPPMHGLEDNLPDVHDEADFDIPDTQAVLERFMTHMSKQADVEYQALSDLFDNLPGVHCHYVSHDTVRKLLVSQGTTAGLRPCVPFQRHTGDSR
jgi:hypothetical protein